MGPVRQIEPRRAAAKVLYETLTDIGRKWRTLTPTGVN